jgi:hypothetical protein
LNAPQNKWAPDYTAIWESRIKRLENIRANPSMLPALHAFYARPENCVKWIEDWCVTYDPRNVGTDKPTTMPFILFPRQVEMVDWLVDSALKTKKDGAIDKCRDMGATWVADAVSVWLWRYYPGTAIGWGSRKEKLVDEIGIVDSIFEKFRVIIRNMPKEMRPKGFDCKKHMPFMKITNPENGSTISGECGDAIGRGGRKTIYFKDESAFYPRPAGIESALGNNTNVQIDISTHNGTDTVFYAKTMTYPKDRLFVLNWNENPMHDQEWFQGQKDKYTRMGMPWLLEQEVLRNPAGSKPGVVIQSKWVQAAIDAHKAIHLPIDGARRIGMDVADEGPDQHAMCERHGILIKDIVEWYSEKDEVPALRAILWCDEKEIDYLVYDNIGVGVRVKDTITLLNPEREIKINAAGWCAGGGVVEPEEFFAKGKRNRDMFKNAKAQAWWELRERFRKTYDAIENDGIYEPDELISISGDLENLMQFCNQLSQPTYKMDGAGKVMIDKKPDNTKSPNMADAAVIVFARHEVYAVTHSAVVGLY